jgi:mono/diheme cytochrome c family protein
MKKLVLLTALVAFILLTSCKKGELIAIATPTPEDVIKRGEYLVETMGCNDCHSPKKMGERGPEIIPELLLSGYPADRPIAKFDEKKIKEGFAIFYPDLTAAAGPWGVSFAGNLTPDDTGIGTWSEEQFKKAVTQGKFKGMDGGRILLPPMPWPGFAKMTDEDVHALFMYLKSIQLVENIVPAPVAPENM